MMSMIWAVMTAVSRKMMATSRIVNVRYESASRSM